MRKLLIAALLLAAAGCGQNGSDPVERPLDVDPVSGGTLTVAVDSDPGSLNPVLRRTALSGSILGEINDGLIEMNPQLEFEPGLAKRWIWSDDGLAVSPSPPATSSRPMSSSSTRKSPPRGGRTSHRSSRSRHPTTPPWCSASWNVRSRTCSTPRRSRSCPPT